MYGVGALLAGIGILLRLELPESARWLVGQGRIDEADKVVSDMEVVAAKHGPLPEVRDDIPMDEATSGEQQSVRCDLRPPGLCPTDDRIARGVVPGLCHGVRLLRWLYIDAELAQVRAVRGRPHHRGGRIWIPGLRAVRRAFADRLERKFWLPIGATITVIGGVIVAEAGTTGLAIAFIGAAIVFFGFNIWVPMTYALSTESFPTRARLTGFGLVDGVGHLGGGIGVLVIAPQIPNMTVLEAMLLVSAFLVLAAIVAQFSPNTRGRHYEEVSP